MDTNNGSSDPQKPLAWTSSAPKNDTPVPPPLPHKNSPHYEKPTLGAAPKGISRYIAWGVAGIIVGVLLVWGFTSRQSPPTTDTAGGAAATSTQKAKPAQNAASGAAGLLVVNSQPAGMSVAVTGASVSKPTWVVVYESAGGKPGNVLGAALFFGGSSSGTVQLLRSTRAGETYFVGESVDNGDRQFSLKNDTPLRDANGNLRVSSFLAQ